MTIGIVHNDIPNKVRYSIEREALKCKNGSKLSKIKVSHLGQPVRHSILSNLYEKNRLQ